MEKIPQTSRELAERIQVLVKCAAWGDEDIVKEQIASLIDAWVRAREARWNEHAIAIARDTFGAAHPAQAIFEQALATARKQLEEKVK